MFAKILRNELPSERVYEDEQTLVIMDIMPRTDGHVLVIPKTPARNMLDASPEQLAACMVSLQKVSHAIIKAFAADGITVQQFNEAAGGQIAFHLHFHILPRYDGIRLDPPSSDMEKPEVLKANADKIRAALATIDWPIKYRSGSYSPDTRSIHPCRLDCGFHAADGLDNNFQIDIQHTVILQ